MKTIALFVFLFPLFLFAKHVSSIECTQYDSKILGKPVRYCLQRSEDSAKPTPQEPVIYFFHGLGGSSSSWTDNGYDESLATLVSSGNFPKATVISFDTEEASFFSDFGDAPSGPQSYETWFVKEFVPEMEKTYGVCCQRKCRTLAGLSMGGYGAAKMLFKHPTLFSSAAVNSPALSPFNIHETDSIWTQYFNRHPIGAAQGFPFLFVIRHIFPSWDIFNANDPAFLLQAHTPQVPVSFFMDVGGKDYFGFQEGYYRFKDFLDRAHIPYVAKYYPEQGHDFPDERRTDLLRFLGKKLSE